MIDTSNSNRIGARKVFIVQGSICTLNEYTRLTRANKYTSASTKKHQEDIITLFIRSQLKGWRTECPVYIIFNWIMKNKKKDKDNIAFGKKFILDALVKTGTIPNDSWKYIEGFEDHFTYDSQNGDAVRVEIQEVKK